MHITRDSHGISCSLPVLWEHETNQALSDIIKTWSFLLSYEESITYTELADRVSRYSSNQQAELDAGVLDLAGVSLGEPVPNNFKSDYQCISYLAKCAEVYRA